MRIEHEHWNEKQIVRTHVMEIHRSKLILPMEGGRGNSWVQFPARVRTLADWQFRFIPAQWCQCPVWRGGGLPHWHGMDSFSATLMWGVCHDFPNVFHSPHPIGCSALPRDIQSGFSWEIEIQQARHISLRKTKFGLVCLTIALVCYQYFVMRFSFWCKKYLNF